MIKAAENIKTVCEEVEIQILSLAPFENFEGDNRPLEDRLQTANQWIEIARRLQAPYLQVPSQYSVDSIGDEDILLSELRQVADLGSAKQPLVSIAYEPLS